MHLCKKFINYIKSYFYTNTHTYTFYNNKIKDSSIHRNSSFPTPLSSLNNKSIKPDKLQILNYNYPEFIFNNDEIDLDIRIDKL